MTDHHEDPLAGRDAYPQHQIDHLRLHPARQELLEEIVSTSGPSTDARSGRRLLVPIGIAAAIAVVAGGIWLVTADNGDDDADPQVAASPLPSASAEPTSAPTTQPRKELRRGDVLTRKQCRGARRAITVDKLSEALELLSEQTRRHNDGVVLVYRENGRVLAVNDSCTVVRVVKP